jgi:LexA-binding, inner membrane-associated putative hydrolase
MFIGHFGVGLGAKKIDSKPSLGTLFLAAQFLDLLWPVFLLLGIERVKIEPGLTPVNPLDFTYYPFSHSLLFALLWSLLFGIIYFLFKKDIKTSILLGVLVLSHWILDLIVHIPDLPLSPWSNIKVGFGLWNSAALTIIVEGLIFIVGAYYYFKVTKAKNKKGQISLWSLLIFLVMIYIVNLFGSAPPSVNAIAIAGLFQWLIIIWGYWIDRNREPV